MSFRLIFALLVSFALHLGAFYLGRNQQHSSSSARLPMRAELRALPPVMKEDIPDKIESDPLLKNTLDSVEKKAPAKMEPAPVVEPRKKEKAQTAPRQLPSSVQAAQKKLSKFVFYPPEAVANGWEGEVRLILKIREDGAIDDVSVAASSGHTVLDHAAEKAAYAMGRLQGAPQGEMILPVIFRLQ